MSISSSSKYSSNYRSVQSAQQASAHQTSPHFGFEVNNLDSLQAISSVSLYRISEDGKKALPVHPLKEIPYKSANGYHVIVEIIGGSSQKTELDEDRGVIVPDVKKGKFRFVSYLPYPATYGSLPQTVSDKRKGGDGDPLDVFILSSPEFHKTLMLPGQILQDIRIVGAIDMVDSGERDVKLIGIAPNSQLSKAVNTLSDLENKHPGVVESLEHWLGNYKGPAGGVEIRGRLNEVQANQLIEEGHQDFQRHEQEAEQETHHDASQAKVARPWSKATQSLKNLITSVFQ